MQTTLLRQSKLMGVVFALILIPFFVFEEWISMGTKSWINRSENINHILVAVILALLMVSDLLLPVPSSMISIAAGFIHGLALGTVVSFSGMVGACALGYYAGRMGSDTKWIGKQTRKEVEFFFNRYGFWAIVLARAVPVLAEASVFYSGMSGMSFRKFMLISSMANLGISFVYAFVGAFAMNTQSFFLAFAGAILIPLVALMLKNTISKKRKAALSS